MDILEKKIKLEDIDILSLLGSNDSYLQMIENKFQASITARGNTLIIRGTNSEIKAIEAVVKELTYILKRNGELNTNDIATVMDLVDVDKNNSTASFEKDNVIYWGVANPIRARNPKQHEYYDKVLKNDILFSIGPAGTGKTFLAVAMALAALRRNEVSKIILSRPAVEAGESLGFLPGDLKEKIDPYLRPLTDALFYMVNAEKTKNLMEKNIIEIIPLAYMRGRTLNNSFIILDEAQNATITQMKMFLTRLGENSKAIVTGDITQIDLYNREDCGLIHANNLLHNIDGIDFVYFSDTDVVRHRLVGEIIRAYDREAEQKRNNSENKNKESSNGL